MNIKPLFDKVIIKADKESNEAEGGLIMPTGSKDTPLKGVVVACGDDLTIKKEDRVMFGVYSGAKFKHEGEEYLMMRESDCFAIFK